MFVTKEFLQSKDACIAGIKWFEHYFPNGGETAEIIAHKKVPMDFLYWGYSNSTLTDEEKQLFRERLNICCANPQTVLNSKNILDSEDVHYSRNIENSKYIFSSKFIKNSNMIHSSKKVEDSNYIFDSKDVVSSSKIYSSNHITNSNNVIISSNISDSNGIAYGNNISNSFCIIGAEDKILNNISSSCFIFNSNNIKKCLFCSNIESGELLLFNKPISEYDFNMYYNEFLKQLRNWNPNFISNWGENNTNLVFPSINLRQNFLKYIPKDFIIWIKSLPQYDEKLFHELIEQK